MAHALHTGSAMAPAGSGLLARGATYQAYLVLYVGFIVLPILAGLDKFFHILVDWDKYLAPLATQIIPVSPHTFMLGAGVIEIVAGILIAVWPRIAAYIVMLWLWGIVANLLILGNYYDIALRDFGLSLAALALARLSQAFGRVLDPGL